SPAPPRPTRANSATSAACPRAGKPSPPWPGRPRPAPRSATPAPRSPPSPRIGFLFAGVESAAHDPEKDAAVVRRALGDGAVAEFGEAGLDFGVVRLLGEPERVRIVVLGELGGDVAVVFGAITRLRKRSQGEFFDRRAEFQVQAVAGHVVDDQDLAHGPRRALTDRTRPRVAILVRRP